MTTTTPTPRTADPAKARSTERHVPGPDENRDLGFGSVVAATRRGRLLNRDGSFNVTRRGLALRASLTVYDFLLYLSWPRFLALFAGFYLVLNTLFAFAYFCLGADALAGAAEVAAISRFWQAFFFSVESLSTVGYGHIVPVGWQANALMTVESLFGVLIVAMVTGISFARFSRPMARIQFSRNAVIAPYHGVTGFMFRLVNQRKSELIEADAQLSFSRFEKHDDGREIRRFYPLHLERRRVTFLPLAWTVVHPIDEASPLFGLTPADLAATEAEFLILLTAIDEASAATVHARTSYRAEELVWNAKFADLFQSEGSGPGDGSRVAIDARRLDALVELDPR